MLYPLSYGGARAQSSDPGTQLGWQGVVPVHPATRTPVFPAQDHSRANEPRSRLAVSLATCAGAGLHKASSPADTFPRSSVGIRTRCHPPDSPRDHAPGSAPERASTAAPDRRAAWDPLREVVLRAAKGARARRATQAA